MAKLGIGIVALFTLAALHIGATAQHTTVIDLLRHAFA